MQNEARTTAFTAAILADVVLKHKCDHHNASCDGSLLTALVRAKFSFWVGLDKRNTVRDSLIEAALPILLRVRASKERRVQ